MKFLIVLIILIAAVWLWFTFSEPETEPASAEPTEERQPHFPKRALDRASDVADQVRESRRINGEEP